MVIQFIFFAILLFLFLRLAGWFIRIIPVSKFYHKTIMKVFPLFEMGVWLLFTYYATRNLFKEQYYVEVILFVIFLIIVFFVSWFFLRDFMAGVFLKSENLLESGIKIKVANYEGHINKVGYRSIEIRTDDNSLVKIPFSKITGHIITFPDSEAESFYKHAFELQLPKKKPYPDYIEYLRFLLLNSPWVMTSKDPEIEMVSSTDEAYTFKIEFFALNEEQAYKSEDMLKKGLEKNAN